MAITFAARVRSTRYAAREMGVKPADDSWLTPGLMLLDKYRVESILGKGGMGIVVRAYHPGLDERVAIKILRDDVADPEAARRFLREAQATVRLKSEHVARVSDVGTTDEGMSYMVMELLDGGDIGQMLEAQRFEAPDAVTLVLQACVALAEAHALGIVHRDIKPANLFVTMRDERPHVKVLDFGISKVAAGMDGTALTQTQSMLGTPAYMSPEQMRSARTVDLRSDVWSIGTVLYEMIEGELPFTAENFSEMVVKVSIDAPTPPVVMEPALAAIVLRCLEKSADARFASTLELAQALAPFARDAAGARTALDAIARYAGATVGPLRPVSAPAGSAAWSGAALEPAAAVSAADLVETYSSRSTRLAAVKRRWLRRGGVAAAVLGVGIVLIALAAGSGGGKAPVEDAKMVVAPVVPTAPAITEVVVPPAGSDAGSAVAADVRPQPGNGSAAAAITKPAGGLRRPMTLPHLPPKVPTAGSSADAFSTPHAPPQSGCSPFDNRTRC